MSSLLFLGDLIVELQKHTNSLCFKHKNFNPIIFLNSNNYVMKGIGQLEVVMV
ncbi:hypothetical protein KAR34_03150 [bacterium]|nr:hypothetical protein [bacterium]